MTRSWHWLLWLAFSALLIFLSFNRHSHSGYFNYHSELWSDKAGYNVYLPAAFIYNFDAAAFPEKVDSLTGNGFSLDHSSGKVYTKYTYGVALMQAPFWLIAHILAPQLGYDRDGFSPVYQKVVNLAGVSYLILGLLFLMKFMRLRHSRSISIVVISLILLSTNLFYYGIVETGMSHVYSFFLFSGFIYLIAKTNYLTDAGMKQSFLLGLLFGLVVLIRPVNILLFSAFFFLEANNLNTLKNRLTQLWRFSKRYWPAMILTPLLIWTPQMIYWSAISGDAVHYSYVDEGFNWLRPQLLHLWFAPRNGLFLYAPLMLLVLISALQMPHHRRLESLYFLSLFLLLSYILSAWWDWGFGCSLGARSFVEYFALFSIPLAWLIQSIQSSRSWLKGVAIAVLVLLIALNIKISYTFDNCFHSEDAWDWRAYFALILEPAA